MKSRQRHQQIRLQKSGAIHCLRHGRHANTTTKRRRLRFEALEQRRLLAVLFSDTFPMTSYDSTKWELVNGATIDSVGIAEPSAPYSARLNGSPDGNDLIQSKVIDLSSHSSATLAYAFERTGGGNSPEINDDLIVEYKNSSGVWIELDRQLGSGVDMSTYSEVQKPLPVAALHSAFQFRFRTSSTPVGAFDDWFVDDVLLTGDSALAAPVMTAEPATTAGTSNTVAWSVVVGATQYYAEYDTDSTFSSPDGNSGWISSSSHTFTGLNTDITYY